MHMSTHLGTRQFVEIVASQEANDIKGRQSFRGTENGHQAECGRREAGHSMPKEDKKKESNVMFGIGLASFLEPGKAHLCTQGRMLEVTV